VAAIKKAPPRKAGASPPSPLPLCTSRSGSAEYQQQQKTPHINKEYTTEQNYFIIYHAVDLKRPWKQVEVDFENEFGSGVRRTDGGLQSTYYRCNDHCPVVDANGLLTYGEGEGFDRNGVKVGSAKIRSGKVTLVDRYAEELVQAGYRWIQPNDMLAARELGASPPLPSHILTCMAPPDYAD
jgi:hypothetical protein